ncbi:MAG: Gfo/Idh/MocA family oxidoreductase [Pseudomonadales bacterium]|nr:Gfo/Idh/MocA family oxidoreductase [Pseudomonadales bacterium]NRA16755.1 Gfo/Idh/MocA family oxidoreductase [Oceanospirillaceae bacterium]
MSKILNWGILSSAKIARKQVVPALQQSKLLKVTAIASRSADKAQAAADELGIDNAYASYEQLLADPDIDVIYNPLPNHLHVPLTIAALQAGKHVLCEKPLALTADEAEQIIAASNLSGKLVEEAFMVRSNPQWQWLRQQIRNKSIGELRAIQGAFSYFNNDVNNIRNQPDIGGGGIYDIGCYLINTSRFITSEEPCRIAAVLDNDPLMKTDRLASAIMVFPSGVQMTWLCSTQLVPYQRVSFLGTSGRMEVQIPFNAPNDRENLVLIDDGTDLSGAKLQRQTFPVSDQYLLQAENFCTAINQGTLQHNPLEDSIANMRVIDAVFKAAQTGQWVDL